MKIKTQKRKYQQNKADQNHLENGKTGQETSEMFQNQPGLMLYVLPNWAGQKTYRFGRMCKRTTI